MIRRPFRPSDQIDMFDETLPLRQQDRIGELPASAQELVAVIGLDATIGLVKEEGGNELRLPERTDGSSNTWLRLVELIGHEASVQLVRRWPDSRVYVPMCSAALRAERNRDIVRRYSDGESFDAIRRRYKITRVHLYRLLKKPV